ncbi:NmrA-like family domain-containing protein 1 [Pseudocercospora fuligena]|uniref:NmrA-like family domain-containing protein 1 n=1 Tax=Pseudocercospora fuligena TaxID=685502 RepID=A0A8H6RCH8_9PEZI|nr:NmrA-like family domain-containing protein 1 [Pseudocercospora fuligena]
MSKILAVLGSTGQQGGSVINNVLSDPELSQLYSVRAISRDAASEKAKQLQKRVDVVEGDVSDRESLQKALSGVDTVFAMTTPSVGPEAVEIEFNTAKNIADVAVSSGVKYLIWSTLPAVSEISNGKYSKVTAFDAKAKAGDYIRGLPIKSAFVSLGFFMENFRSQPFLTAQRDSNGAWIMARPHSANTSYPLIAAVEDIGKFVGAILAEPERYERKRLCAAEALYSVEDIAKQLSKSAGQKIVFKQVSTEDFDRNIPFMADVFVDAYCFAGEYGYFGPGMEEQVAWAARNARGKLLTLEQFLQANPLTLAEV